MSNAHWTVADAKARLSEVIEAARRDGPQTITKNGRSTAVLVSVEEWERKTKRSGSLAAFLLASPLRGANVEIERPQDESGEMRRTGFLVGQIAVPDDFDAMGRADIEKLSRKPWSKG